jgi:hypothetical protein
MTIPQKEEALLKAGYKHLSPDPDTHSWISPEGSIVCAGREVAANGAWCQAFNPLHQEQQCECYLVKA